MALKTEERDWELGDSGNGWGKRSIWNGEQFCHALNWDEKEAREANVVQCSPKNLFELPSSI